MILRVVNGRFPEGRLAAVREALERTYVPAAGKQPGLERYLIATRSHEGGNEIAFMSVWTDVESALAAYGGDLSAIRTLDEVGHGETLDSVDYFEVDDEEVRRGPGVPRFLRLTAGSVGRGFDADIQRELRSRLGGLGAEAVEAYVGRRVKGSSIEIAFMSTWTAAADEAALNRPIWPDISAAYDAFWIRVYDVLLESSRAG